MVLRLGEPGAGVLRALPTPWGIFLGGILCCCSGCIFLTEAHCLPGEVHWLVVGAHWLVVEVALLLLVEVPSHGFIPPIDDILDKRCE